MAFEIQKAAVLKRFAAFVIDIILRGLVVFILLGLYFSVSGYEKKAARMEEIYTEYSERYGIPINDDRSMEEMTPEEQERFRQANEAMGADEEAVSLYRNLMVSYLAGVSGCVSVAYLLLEFVVPLLFGDGRTVGKRLFNLCVVHTNGVKMGPGAMFFRSMLGKYTVETMIPLLSVLMLPFGLGPAGFALSLILGVVELVMFLAGKNRQLIHDIFGQSVVADYLSQPIYASVEEMKAETKGSIMREASRWNR